MLKEILVETTYSQKMKEIHNEINPFGSYEDMGYRMFDPIEISENKTISIQASYTHYCSPRQTLPVEAYDSMEMAVLIHNEFSDIGQIIDNSDLIRRIEEHRSGVVYAGVPVELLEELIKELKG